MKNRTNLLSILAFSFGLAGTLIFLSSCSENNRTDSKDRGNNGNMDQRSPEGTMHDRSSDRNMNNPTSRENTILVVENNKDSTFLIKVAEMQLEEIRLGRLAQQKGTTPHVKELGKMMEDEHTKTLRSLETLARGNSVTIPTSASAKSEEAFNDLGKKTGADFGKSYSKMMVDHHEDAIDLFEKAAKDSESQEIRTWASSQLPTLRTHLKHAEACKVECDKL
jgi:putative membrane protein